MSSDVRRVVESIGMDSMDGKSDAAAAAKVTVGVSVAGENNETQAVKSNWSVKLTDKALDEKVKALQNVGKDKFCKLKNLREVAEEFMQSGNAWEQIINFCGESKMDADAC